MALNQAEEAQFLEMIKATASLTQAVNGLTTSIGDVKDDVCHLRKILIEGNGEKSVSVRLATMETTCVQRTEAINKFVATVEEDVKERE